MGWLWVILAACGMAGSNLYWRRTLDVGGSPRAYLVLQQGLSLLVQLVMGGAALQTIANSPLSWMELFPMLCGGVGAGLALSTMLYAMGLSFARGPSGLTIATLNAATVVPGVLLGLLLGADYGCPLTLASTFGLSLVLVGLFWSTRRERGNGTWWRAVSMAFGAHVLLLLLMRWQSMLTRADLPEHPLLPSVLPAESAAVFLPAMFGICFLLQLGLFVVQERRMLRPQEWRWGGLGGLCNGLSALALLQGIQSLDSPFLFPAYAICIIVATNLWSQWLYREPVNWSASAIAAAGIVVGG